jgi:hypothetical protein
MALTPKSGVIARQILKNLFVQGKEFVLECYYGYRTN